MAENDDLIYCGHCKQFKPASEFSRNKTKKSGRQSYCKECSNELVRQHYEKKRTTKPVEVLTITKPLSFSDATIAEMKEYKEAGFTDKEIAEYVGLTESQVRDYFRFFCEDDKPQEKTETKSINNSTSMPPKNNTSGKVTLDSFQARDLIKHLYNLGYRIEDNKLVCYVKTAVNVKDIIGL